MAGDFYANSGYYADIQAAVNIAKSSGGGNVFIPAGTFNFHRVGEAWTPVNTPAGVNIYGAPTQRDANGQVTQYATTLVMPYSAPGDPYGTWTGTTSSKSVWFSVSGSGDASKPTRISNLHLQGYRTINSNDHMQSVGVSIGNVVNYRVDHCFFDNICGGGVEASGYACCGVTDHCKFVNNPAQVTSNIATCDVDYGASFYRAGSGYTFAQLWDSNIQNVVGHYTNYSHYVEDCTFGKWRHEVAANDGAHYVVRYCTFDGGEAFGTIDAHGAYNLVGTRAIEVYNSKFLNGSQGGTLAACFWRGGGGVWFNNNNDGTFHYVSLVAEGNVQACWPHDIYVWNHLGTPLTVAYQAAQQQGSDGLMHPAPNLDFFEHALPGYTPYTYPHPLVTGEEPPPDENVTPKTQLLNAGVYRITVPSTIII